MQSLETRLNKYEDAHSNSSNRILHYIGIPAIFIGVVMFFSWFTVGIFGRWHIEFAWFGVIGLLVYYFFLNVRVAVVATVILILLTWFSTWLARPMPTKFSFILFLILLIGGFVCLFVGHSFEKKKPSFAKDIIQLTVAPLFLIIEVMKKFGLESHLAIGEKKATPKSKKSKS